MRAINLKRLAGILCIEALLLSGLFALHIAYEALPRLLTA